MIRQSMNLTLGLLVVAASARDAQASRIAFRLTGTINVFDPFNVLPDGIESGMPFTGTFAYDPNAADQLPDDPNRGFYGHLPPTTDLGFVIRIGERVFRTDPDEGVYFTVENDVYLGSGPLGEPRPPFGDSIHGQNIAIFPFACQFPRFRFRWLDETTTSFDSDRPPLALDPDLLHSNDSLAPILQIDGYLLGTVTTGPRVFSINGSIDRIELIPEPTSLTLAYVALCSFACVAMCRCKWKRPSILILQRSESYETPSSTFGARSGAITESASVE